MRTRYFVGFNISRSEAARFKGHVKDIGLIEFWEEPHNERALPHLYCTLDSNDSRLAALRELLKGEGIEWSERVEHIYSDQELRAFPLLGLGMGGKPISGGGPTYGTKYDLSTGCPYCGTGSTQVSPLMMPLSELPNKRPVGQTCLSHRLVDSSVREALLIGRVSGLELRQVHFYRNNEPLPWWQMIASHILPRMSSSTTSIIHDVESMWACPVCERDMYCGRPDDDSPIVYDKSDVDPQVIPDVVSTWECFGRSVLRDDPERNLLQTVAQPAMLVKPRVFDIFRRLKVRGMQFSPVCITD